MNKNLKIGIWFILLIFSLNIGFAPCCVDSNGQPSYQLSCGEGEDLSEPDSDVCILYKQYGCKVSGRCISINGETSFWSKDNGINFRNGVTCSGGAFVLYRECAVTSSGSGTGTTGTTGTGTTVDTGEGGSQHQIDPGTSNSNSGGAGAAQTQTSTFFQQKCSDRGGQFGFFVDKLTCNAMPECLYNPYYSGFFSTKLIQDNIGYTFDNFEKNPCVPKINIDECSDYKTKSNCEQNSALDYLTAQQGYDYTNLQLGCVWLNSSAYSEGNSILDAQNGMCVSNMTFQSKHFDRRKYTDRMNLIKNPSFEVEGVWNNYNSLNKINPTNSHDNKCYQGKSCYKLNGVISQNISGIAKGSRLNSFLYFQRKQNIEDITVEVSFYNFSNEYINRTTLIHVPLNDTTFNYSFGGFERLDFTYEIEVPDGTNYLVYKILGNDVVIDAVSLELSTTNSRSASNSFSMVEVISKNASYCHICFNKLDLNSCTKTKSDYLGDCTYMTSDLSKAYSSSLPHYTGSSENNYMKNDSKWQSQSLANSLLFCEMYTNQTECTDGDNYVNRVYSHLHPKVNGNLCKWVDSLGCYKDSNNDNLPDTTKGGIGIKVFFNSQNYNSVYVQNNYVRAASLPNSSDFALACDTIPPTGYVYFVGKNQSLDNVSIFSSQNNYGPIGNVDIYIDSFDYPVSNLDSCRDFSFSNYFYFDYNISNSKPQTYYKSTSNNIYFDKTSIQDFFTNSSSETILVEGRNMISLRIVDRSGNVGYDTNFSLDLDLYGPSINLSHNGTFINEIGNLHSSTFGKNTTLNVTLKDYSKVSWCNYTLTPHEVSIDESFYTPQGSINISNILDGFNTGSTQFIVPFNVPIRNTTINGDVYELDITCSDIFDQRSNKTYLLKFDYDTRLILVSPQTYINYSNGVGFFNSGFNVTFISDEKKLEDCDITGDLINSGTNSMDLEEVSLAVFTNTKKGFYSSTVPFTYSSQAGTDFYTNISFPLTLKNKGVNNISVTCLDKVGNSFSKNITYYLDNETPEFLNYNLVPTVVSNRTNVVKIGTAYYTTNIQNAKINLTFNGTLSCISKLNNLTAYNESEVAADGDAHNFTFTLHNENGVNLGSNIKFKNLGKIDIERTCNSTTFVSNFILLNLNVSQNWIMYQGISDIQTYPLITYKYGIEYTDAANNSYKENDLSFYYDSHVPKFNFTGGNIVEYTTSTGVKKLFTQVENPQIRIDFMTPSYRNYTCNVTGVLGIGTASAIRNSSIVNSVNNILNFGLGDIDSRFKLGNAANNKTIQLTFNCSDNYGPLNSINIFTLHFDNTAPQLKSVKFVPQQMFIKIPNGNVYSSEIRKDLLFELNNTGEEIYTCEYVFSSNHYSPCKLVASNFTLPGTNLIKTETVSLIEGIAADGNPTDSQCPNSYIIPAGPTGTRKSDTSVSVTARCFDALNQVSNVVSAFTNITYVDSSLIFANFSYDDDASGRVYPYVGAFMPYDGGIIITNRSRPTEIITTLTTQSLDPITNNYVYTYPSGFSTAHLPETQAYLVDVHGLSSSGTIEDTRASQFIVDRTAPSLTFTIPDAIDNNNVIYDSEIYFDFQTSDLNNLKKVELIKDGSGTIFTYFVHNNTYVNTSNVAGDYGSWSSSCSGTSCTGGTLKYIGGAYNTAHTFRMKSYDIFGNVNTSVSLTVTLKDGVAIKLMDSSNTRISSNQRWYTNVDAPTIRFNTSKIVKFCEIFPMIDLEWNSIVPDATLEYRKFLDNNTFSLDLSSIVGFNLSKRTDVSNQVRIYCRYNATSNVTVVKEIISLNYLPDYVLNSTEGFVLNEDPFTTEIKVKSVGPYKPLDHCNYTINSNTVRFAQTNVENFNATLNLSTLSTGTYTLTLVCADVLGIKGPTKEYQFKVNKNLILDVQNVTLIKDDKVYVSQMVASRETIYVPEVGDYKLKFNTNKKNGLTCDYRLSPSTNVIINFFKNLLGIGYKTIPTSNLIYGAEVTLALTADTSNLNIDCEIAGDPLKSLSYRVVVDKSQVNSTIDSITAIN